MMNNSSSPKVYCFGEILWDVLPDGPQPGGAPLNVAYHLNQLNHSAGLISRVGKDEDGRKLEMLLQQWEVHHVFLQKDSHHDTSRVIAQTAPGEETKYEILYPVAWDYIESQNEITEAIKEAGYFVFGSLASRNEVTRKTLFELLDQAHFKILDINLRPPFYEREVLSKLLSRADLLKINGEELEVLSDMFGSDSSTTDDKARSLQQTFEVPEMIITHGAVGAAYYSSDENYKQEGITVQVKDTVGSGDAFLASFIAGKEEGKDPEKNLKDAVAMGSFIAAKKGGCPDYTYSEYLKFLKENR